MRREKASATNLYALARQLTCLITDTRAHRVSVALSPDQADAKPVAAMADIVPQQQWGGIIVADEHIHTAIVIEVSSGKAPGCKSPGKHRPTLRAHIPVSLTFAMKEEQWLLPRDGGRCLINEIVGKSVRKNQVQIAIIVVIKKLEPPA